MKRPNILLLLADQLRADCIGPVNPHIRTPHLDAFARAGLRLNRCYAPTPVCLPCRASLVTGQYASTHRAAHNTCELDPAYPTLLSTTLRNAGYFTAIVGKSHLGNCHDPLSPEAAPHIHNTEYFRRWFGPHYGFEHAEISIGHTTEKHACGMHYGAWLKDRGVDPARYFGHTAYEQYGPWDLPLEHHSGQWIAERSVDLMRQAAERDQPFFVWANFQDPHNPCMVPEPYASMYNPADLPVYGFKPGEPECFASKPAFYQQILQQPGPYAAHPDYPPLKGHVAGNVCTLPWTAEQIAANAAAYYGMVSLLDHQVGQILSGLDRLGLAENTLVVFSSDHGELLGDHGFWWKSLVSYEESIRVPLLARWPGTIPRAARSEAFTSLVDLFPTFCAAANVPAPLEVEGVSQLDVWTGEQTSARRAVVVEEQPNNGRFVQRILLQGQWKLAWYAGDPLGELYDMQADPHQIHNLWSDPAHRATREHMISLLLEHETGKRLPRPSPGIIRQQLLAPRTHPLGS